MNEWVNGSILHQRHKWLSYIDLTLYLICDFCLCVCVCVCGRWGGGGGSPKDSV